MFLKEIKNKYTISKVKGPTTTERRICGMTDRAKNCAVPGALTDELKIKKGSQLTGKTLVIEFYRK